MKTMKRALAVLLAAVLLCVGVPLAVAEDEPTYQLGDQIQFGTYPQTRVEETPELLAAAESATWKSYEYYSGTYNPREGTGYQYDGNMKPCGSMEYSDFFFHGQKYRAVLFHSYRAYATGYYSYNYDYQYQTQNGYTPRGTYYFKYEPLTWRVIDPTAKMIMCESIIDSQSYQNTVSYFSGVYYQDNDSSVYANDYASSSIRAWLNHDFYETAFTEVQKENIQTTELNNDAYYNGKNFEDYNSAITNDKIYLPSYLDVYNVSYGFYINQNDATRIASGTD